MYRAPPPVSASNLLYRLSIRSDWARLSPRPQKSHTSRPHPETPAKPVPADNSAPSRRSSSRTAQKPEANEIGRASCRERVKIWAGADAERRKGQRADGDRGED